MMSEIRYIRVIIVEPGAAANPKPALRISIQLFYISG
jgi:hypothetical protein